MFTGPSSTCPAASPAAAINCGKSPWSSAAIDCGTALPSSVAAAAIARQLSETRGRGRAGAQGLQQDVCGNGGRGKEMRGGCFLELVG